jgi:hypothetical protein
VRVACRRPSTEQRSRPAWSPAAARMPCGSRGGDGRPPHGRRSRRGGDGRFHRVSPGRPAAVLRGNPGPTTPQR